MRILFALLTMLAGLLLVFGGYRVARIFIPLIGFVAGLSVGGAVYADLASTPFLGTVLGVVVGIALGLVLALFAYLYYYAAIIVLAAALGYSMGSSFILFFGFHPGILSTVVGLGIGLLVGVAAVVLNAPRYFLIILTAVTGAVTAVGGVLLLFNTIPLETFNYAVAHAKISNSFIWSLLTAGLAIVGIATQAMTTSHYYLEEWTVGGDQTHHMPPTPHAPGVH